MPKNRKNPLYFGGKIQSENTITKKRLNSLE